MLFRSLEDELRKFRNPESKKENPIENPQEKPEEPTEIKPKKVGSTLLTKLEGEIATIDEKIAEIDTKIDTLQKTIEKQKKEMDLLLKAQIIEGGLQRKISQYQETIKPQKEELASLNEERASLQSEKEKLQKDAEEVSKGPEKTGLKELQSLKQEARDRNKIKEAVNLDQLTSALASIEKIPSSTHSSFTGEEMTAVIQDLRSENPTMTLLDVTRGYDLRDKVEELLRVENPGGIERSEFNKIEERLNKAREKYSQEYLVYVQSQNKPSLLNKALSALGMAKKAEEVSPNESYIEAKKEYDEALAAMGQYLFDAKKEQLERISKGEGEIDDDETGFLLQRFSEEDDGTHSIGYRAKRIIDIREGRLTESEKDLLLKNYKMRSIFQKVVLDEHNLLTQRSIELQPKSEKGGARKIFDSAVKRFAALPQSVKMVAGLSIIIGAGAMTSGVSLPILASTKVISMLSSMAAARGVGWLADNVSFLKDGSGKRHEKTMQEIRNAFAKGEKSVAQALSETGGAKNKQADEAAKYRLARTLWMAAGGALAGLGVREYLGSAPILHHAPASTEATPSSDQLTPQTEPSPVHHSTSHIVNHDVSNNPETQPEWKHAVVGIEQPDDPAWRGIDHTMERYPEYQRLNPIQRIFVTHSVYHDVLQQSHHHGHHLREIIITPQQFHHHIINSSHFHDPHRIQQIMHDQRRFESFHLRNTHRMPVNVGRNLVFKLQNQAFHHHR